MKIELKDIYIPEECRQLLALAAEKAVPASSANPETGNHLVYYGLLRYVTADDCWQITDEGIAFLDILQARDRKQRRETRRYWITTAIAVLALVVSVVGLYLTVTAKQDIATLRLILQLR